MTKALKCCKAKETLSTSQDTIGQLFQGHRHFPWRTWSSMSENSHDQNGDTSRPTRRYESFDCQTALQQNARTANPASEKQEGERRPWRQVGSMQASGGGHSRKGNWLCCKHAFAPCSACTNAKNPVTHGERVARGGLLVGSSAAC